MKVGINGILTSDPGWTHSTRQMLSRLTFIQMWIKVYNSLDSRCSIGPIYAAISVSEVEGIEVGGRI